MKNITESKPSSQSWYCYKVGPAKQGQFGSKDYINVCYFLRSDRGMELIWNHKSTDLSTQPIFKEGDTIEPGTLVLFKNVDTQKLIIDYAESYNKIKIQKNINQLNLFENENI